MSGSLQIELLEKKHSLKLLYHLRNGPMVKGELCAKVAVGTASAQDRIEDLVSQGLVTEEQESVKPFKKILNLTPKGRKVVDAIVQIESILSETIEAE